MLLRPDTPFGHPRVRSVVRFGLDAGCLRDRATYAAAGYDGAAAGSRCESPRGLHFLGRYDCF
jgi:hypothetical protein